jgi:hypothetical protein
MQHLLIEKSERTPSIEFYTHGELRMEGRSIPENALEFYEEIIEWVKELRKIKPEKVDLHVELEFFNTSTSKLLLHLFKQLDSFKKENSEAQIYWYHEKGDDDMKEAGEDYKSILKLPFHIIEMED